MDEHPQPGQAFMSALVTEHFVLQSARSTTTSEAVGRSAVCLTCVSSSLVAFGFFAAATHRLAPLLATWPSTPWRRSSRRPSVASSGSGPPRTCRFRSCATADCPVDENHVTGAGDHLRPRPCGSL
jgi:hypothetical protein